MKNNNKRNFGLAFVAAGALTGVAAACYAIFKRRKQEQVYHEAEVRAMDEMDDLTAEDESECASCECAEECAASDTECAQSQMELSDETIKTEKAEPDSAPAEKEEKQEQ